MKLKAEKLLYKRRNVKYMTSFLSKNNERSIFELVQVFSSRCRGGGSSTKFPEHTPGVGGSFFAQTAGFFLGKNLYFSQKFTLNPEKFFKKWIKTSYFRQIYNCLGSELIFFSIYFCHYSCFRKTISKKMFMR